MNVVCLHERRLPTAERYTARRRDRGLRRRAETGDKFISLANCFYRHGAPVPTYWGRGGASSLDRVWILVSGQLWQRPRKHRRPRCSQFVHSHASLYLSQCSQLLSALARVFVLVAVLAESALARVFVLVAVLAVSALARVFGRVAVLAESALTRVFVLVAVLAVSALARVFVRVAVLAESTLARVFVLVAVLAVSALALVLVPGAPPRECVGQQAVLARVVAAIAVVAVAVCFAVGFAAASWLRTWRDPPAVVGSRTWRKPQPFLQHLYWPF